MKADVFKIDGVPMGKQRPKASFASHRIYTPSATINYENYVKFCYDGHHHFEDNPVAVELLIFMPIPDSTSKKKRQQMIDRSIRPTKKPDIDNIIKIILDGLNGVAWNDDKQVIEVSAKKYYDTSPRVIVSIKEVAANEG